MRALLFRAAMGLALAMTTITSPAAAQGPADAGRSALLEELSGARLARHSATGQLRFVGGTTARPAATAARLGGPATPKAAADRFMSRYGSLFGLRAPARDLRVAGTTTDPLGRTIVRYQQVHEGVPVMGGDLLVQVGRQNEVVSANGEASISARIETRPRVIAAAAVREAIAAIAKSRGVKEQELSASDPALWIYDPALLGGRALPFTRLVWRLEVTNLAGDMRELVLVDALRGSVALHFDQIAEAKNRRTCDAANTSAQYPCTSPVLTETAGTSTNADVNNAHTFAGHTYDFFFNRFGRDSLDGAGMALKSTVRYCPSSGPCPYVNAFWDGAQMAYGAGFANSDDVVGHELAHGVTDHTSSLFYYYQSGAINEALSDIFGELMDLTNGAGTDTAATRWQLGEDLPPSIGVIRDMADPPAFGDPDRIQSPNYTADADERDAGGVHSNSGVANKAAYLMADGDGFNGQTVTGLGVDKAAAIWYRVETQYLGSASDYADLGSALEQACTDLVGTTPKQNNGSPSLDGAITTANCTEVSQAVLATEMALQPTVAPAPQAPVCTTGTPSNVFFDDLENTASGNWTSAATVSGTNVWYYPQNPNPYTGWDPTYATSGETNIWGDDPGETSDSAIRMTAGVTLPAGAFLHFQHAFGFEDDAFDRYDGGVVEYQVGTGAWVPLATTSINGYNGTLSSAFGNPLGGRSAFTAESNGYISTRFDLGTLAGQSVKFRFRIGSDSSLFDYGWFIDDVRIYTCATGPETTPPTVTAPDANFRPATQIGTTTTPVSLKVKFTAADASGISATDLEQSVNAAAFGDVPLKTATSTGANVSVAPSNATTRQFRARATDAAGNTSGFATGPLFKAKAIQNGSASIVQTGTWTTQSLSSFYGGSVRYASAAGAKQSVTTTMNDAAIVTTKGPNRGKAGVYVDGVLKATLDLYSSTTAYRQVVYAISFPGAAASHKIELRALGTKNASSSGTRVDLDAFLLMTP